MEYRTIYHSDKEKIVDLFVGKSVSRIDGNNLLLNDGTQLEIVGNDGCGGCSEGHYYVTELNECENIITNAEVEWDHGKGDYDYNDIIHLFVYAENRKINLLTVEGHDNGYYGQGFWIQVKKEEA